MILTQANTGTVQLRTCCYIHHHPSTSSIAHYKHTYLILPRKGETSWTTSQTFYTGCLNAVDLPASAALTACTSSQTAFLEVCAGYTFCILSFTLQLAQLTRLMDLNRNVPRYQTTTPVESPAFPGQHPNKHKPLCLHLWGLPTSAAIVCKIVWKLNLNIASRPTNWQISFQDGISPGRCQCTCLVWCFIFPSALRTL